MLRIAVELPAELTTPGEFLADVQAYEVAGVDAIRFGGGPLEPLTLLGAAAAVTSHVRLAASLTGPGRWPAALLAHVLGTLERMSRGRAMLDLEVGPASAEVEELIGALRSAGATPPILVAGAQEAALRCAARLGDGLVCDLAAAGSAFARVRELRPKPDEREPDEREPGVQEADERELWARERARTRTGRTRAGHPAGGRIRAVGAGAGAQREGRVARPADGGGGAGRDRPDRGACA